MVLVEPVSVNKQSMGSFAPDSFAEKFKSGKFANF